jgi:hypothetical protein
MPENNIVVTFKTEQPGGVWPFVRGCFAWVGFGVAVAVGVSIADAPNRDVKPAQAIEAWRAGVQAFETAYHAKADPYGFPPSSYGQAPVDWNDAPPRLFDPIPEIPALPDNPEHDSTDVH